MGKTSRSNDDVMRALRLAAPFAILSQFEDIAHCVEASVAGANALREYGFKTQTAPCAVRLINREVASGATIGYTPRQLYEMMEAAPGEPLPPYEEWQKTYALGVPDAEAPMHQIIWAKANGETYLIDLTIAQLRATGIAGCDSIPLSVFVECGGKDWPVVDKGPWQVVYEASPHSPEAVGRHSARVAQYGAKSKAFTEDMRALMDLAFQVAFDFDAFRRALREANAASYAAASERLHRLMRAAT